ncbi:MAG: N-acetyltransferase, partial [Alphaproteobacteria bacterium]|nr:N-acetyltransferase [Alphaproteobacteria bacterium]
MDGADRLTLRVVDRLASVPAAAWDACAGDHPFVAHAFLQALEESGSATGETGWLPQHLLLEDVGGHLIGAAPLYVKSHSYGEYVFDHGWADAYERAGGRYYPKLQVAVPFTPVPGPRLLLQPEAGGEAMRLLIAGLIEVAKRTEVSSLHITFPTRAECDALVNAGFLRRVGRQFHWENQGYRSFDDFLGAL